MKKGDVVIGRVYEAKVSGRITLVRVVRESEWGGWVGVNESSGREIHVKSAQRLRRLVR